MHGCSVEGGSEVWGTGVGVTHELVHALQYQLTKTNLSSFLSEGLAVALGNENQSSIASLSTRYQALEAQVGAPADAVDYALAGDFVAYLIDAHGFERFLAWSERAPREASVEAVHRAFAQAYGMAVSEMVEERIASRAFFPGARLGMPECAHPTAPWSGDAWSDARSLDCSAPTAIGPIAVPRRERTVVRMTADVPTAGLYLLDVAGEAEIPHLATPCGPLAFSFQAAHQTSVSGAHQFVKLLGSGRHIHEFTAPYPEGSDVSLAMRRLAEVDQALCPPVIEIERPLRSLFLQVYRGEQVQLRFQPRVARRGDPRWVGVVGAELCVGPCEALECRALATLPFNPETFEAWTDLPPVVHTLRYQSLDAIGTGQIGICVRRVTKRRSAPTFPIHPQGCGHGVTLPLFERAAAYATARP